VKTFVKILVLFFAAGSLAFGQTTVTIDDVTQTPILSGDAITIPVSSSSVGNLKSFTFRISYDPASLEFVDVDASTLPNYDTYFSFIEKDGIISVSYFNTSPFSLNGKIFDVNFKYISGFSEVRFTSAKMKDWDGHNLDLILNNGSFAQSTDPQIRVTSPNGGESWLVVGPPQNITWTAVYVSQVRIEYTSDNGGSWEEISAVYDATLDTYEWTIPDITSSDCKVKVSDFSSPAEDESDGTFSIFSTKSITLQTPNGGEEMLPGGTKQIKWTQENIVTVKIEYTTDYNNATPTWTEITTGVPAGNGIYEWAIPSGIPISDFCRIRISDDSDAATNDISDNDFKIVPAPVSVNIAEVIEAHLQEIGRDLGSMYQWWDDSNNSWSLESQNSYYHKNDTLIVKGTVPVTIGWLTSVDYMDIQISYDENVFVFDSVHSTVPELGIFSASAKNGVIHIIWSSASPVDIHGHIFNLHFSYRDYTTIDKWIFETAFFSMSPLPDPSQHDPTMTTGFPSFLPIFVPLDPRNFGKLKVLQFDAKDSRNILIDASDWNNGSLSIDGEDFVKLKTPNGGEVLELIDSPTKIKWERRLTSDLIKIEYSTNSGGIWTTIVSSYDASLESYDWTLPSINSSNCRVMISAVSDPTILDMSENDFTIVAAVALDLLAPDGGEVLQSGETASITWNSSNVSSAKIEYSANGGVVWNEITASAPAQNHLYEWTVPDIASDSCQIRITDVSNPAVFDTSLAFFGIHNTGVDITIPVLSPPAGNVSIPVSADWLYAATSITFNLTYDKNVITFESGEAQPPLDTEGFSSISGNDGVITITWLASSQLDINGDMFALNFSGYDGSTPTDIGFTKAEIMNSDHNLIKLRLIGGGFNTTPTAVETDKPLVYQLNQNYPNPFNPATIIKYSIAEDSFVNLTVYNILGEKVASLINKEQRAGRYEVQWNAASSGGLANGVYIYRIQAGKFTNTKKMILLK